MKAIETSLWGYRFRSRLEARWAVFFDALGIDWVYEPEGYNLSTGECYLPDFYFPDSNCYVEVKPGRGTAPCPNRVYLAGGVEHRWRSHFVDLCVSMNPDFDHNHEPPEIVSKCLSAISRSDALFAVIHRDDLYGTASEIGFATAAGIPCHVVVQRGGSELEHCDLSDDGYWDYASDGINEFWFPGTMSEVSGHGGSLSVSCGLDETIEIFKSTLCYLTPKDEEKTRVLSKDLGCLAVILRDIPKSAEEEFHTQYANGKLQFPFSFSLSLQFSSQDIKRAIFAARSARFEHGESPVRRAAC